MRALRRHLAADYLSETGAEYLRRHPQMVCFAFDLITQNIHLDGRYEDDELEFLATRLFPRLPKGGTCLDVGANIGNHAIAFAPHFARVIALEPHSRTFRLLELNAELRPNVTALNVGASSVAAVASVSADPRNMGGAAIGRSGAGAGAPVDFRLERVDDLAEIAAAGPISFVKIDVEGHERAALVGAAETMRRHRPIVALEVLDNEVSAGSAPAVDFLKSLGYGHFYELREGGWLGRLPFRLRKRMRKLVSLITGRRPSRAGKLVRVAGLEPRSYSMLLCAASPLPREDELLN